jgi:hypothetical protein
LFCYDDSLRQVTWLDLDLSVRSKLIIDSAYAINPVLTCPSFNPYHVWILDSADWSIKRLNTKGKDIDFEFFIPAEVFHQTPKFTMMREYQNFLFLLDVHNGIHVFNGVGKFIRTLPTKNVESFGFLGEELYFFSDGVLHFHDLFTMEERSVETLHETERVILSGERMLCLSATALTIYKFDPQ